MFLTYFSKTALLSVTIFMLIFIASCGSEPEKTTRDNQEQKENIVQEMDPMKNKGIGPIDNIELTDELDEEMVAQGMDIFQSKCEACHHIENRYVGPQIGGLTHRRTPEWIMNMILNPSEMLRNDPIAKELFAEYMIEMTFQNVSEDDARAILEYFRSVDAEGDFEDNNVM